jgi:DNA modification methylase
MRPTEMQWSFDPVVCWWKDGGSELYEIWSAGTASRDFFVANTAPVIARPGNIEKAHPCPRPLDLITHLVGQWVRPETICLDPFMGSGTTGVACAQLGRKFIGIEIERKYFDIACERIDNAYRQQKMFAPVLDVPKQMML